MQCLMKVWYLQQADFMNTWTKVESTVCRKITIRHWVVNWRANRLKDVLTRDWNVHGLWYIIFFREYNAYGLINKKKGRRFLFTVMNWVNIQGDLCFCTASDKWHWTKRVGYCVCRLGSVRGFTYQAICQLFFLAASSLLTARRAKLYLSWIQCSHLGRQKILIQFTLTRLKM